MRQPRSHGGQPKWSEEPREKPTAKTARSGRMTVSLVALSGAAIASVYAVGYFNTNSAATELTSGNLATDNPVPASQQPVGSTAPPATDPTAQPRLQRPSGRDGERGEGERDGAPAQQGQAPAGTSPTQPPRATPPAAGGRQAQASGLRDGSYTGVGNSRHGGMEVTVVVKGGKLVSANVTGCGTRYPCSKVNPLVSEVVNRQGPPVDYVSGATDSSMAYIQAVRSALGQASSPAG